MQRKGKEKDVHDDVPLPYEVVLKKMDTFRVVS